MTLNNNELIETIVKNLFSEYTNTVAPGQDQLSRDQLISKLIVVETTLNLLKEKIKILEWENNVWNSSGPIKVIGPSF